MRLYTDYRVSEQFVNLSSGTKSWKFAVEAKAGKLWQEGAEGRTSTEKR